MREAVVVAGMVERVVVVIGVLRVAGVVVAGVVVAGSVVVVAGVGSILRVISITCNCFCSSQALYRPGRQCSPGLEIRRSGGKDMVFRRPLGYRGEQEQDGFSLR